MFMHLYLAGLLVCQKARHRITFLEWLCPRLGKHTPHYVSMVIGLVCSVDSGAWFFVGNTIRL